MINRSTRVRLFIKEPLFINLHITLSSDQAKYLFKVMRLNEGHSIKIFDGSTGEYEGKILEKSTTSGKILVEKKDKEVLYYLAIAYTHGNNYSKAIETLKEYQKNPGKHAEEISHLIKNYTIAMDMINKPINITFENMGRFINSEFPDYHPFVTKNEKTLVFTSRREKGKGLIEFDGYYPSDVYVCSFNGLKFSKAKNAATLNSIYDDPKEVHEEITEINQTINKVE